MFCLRFPGMHTYICCADEELSFYSVSLVPLASASGAGGRGFNPEPCHTKTIKNDISGYLAWCAAL